MIAIDFQGGAHGNFLEFVCNSMIGITSGLPFNKHGASHKKHYTKDPLFKASHYSVWEHAIECKKIISIRTHEDDLLELSEISLLRAGDYGYDNDQLEINTYNKLNNPDYKPVLDTIMQGYFNNQIATSYNAVRDPSWPDINTISDFGNLPEHIKTECVEQHHLELLELSEERPDCPRHVLHDFFMQGFLNPSEFGFIETQRKKMIYSTEFDVYNFPFDCFYNTTKFIQELKQIAIWSELQYNNWDSLVELHIEFLSRQPYIGSKLRCDDFVKTLLINPDAEWPQLNLLEQAYINAQLTLKQ